ncbi:MAG: ATP-binding protein, partial [Bacteroidia bacterium]
SLETQLLTKIKSISIQMQNKVDLEQKLGNDEQRTLILNEESSTYNVDINLYDKSGKLLSSTKPYLTEEQILSSYMNPKAYSRLLLNKSSQLLIQEELEGSKYLSAYIPLFDEKNDVIGYVNTPFFAKNEQLNKQISNLVVNILNIYFLLLLGGIFLAYIISHQISKPLVLIREKIASTVLQGQNELISYTRDDEIGQLIKQYNKMVLELEESANQMAESEREGAWREMAKQVAHEIKNPLTPMKLSIQHLQRAYDAGPSEKLNVLFAKTSKLLVEQINSLSTMASEFSNFAQMPEDKIERFDVSEVLNGTVELFKRSENTEITSNIDDHKFIIADPEQIRRVFNNLIKNAIQAIPEDRKGMISVKLVSSDSSVHISVADNGKGIPKENYKKVFVPNFSTKNSGMGLGLAICRKIIDTAKGSISFESKINEGTTFNIKLPLDEKS